MTTDETNSLLRKLKGMLTRRRKYIPVPGSFRCEGGPYHGHILRLQDNCTAQLVIGDQWRGRYAQVSDRGYYHTASGGPTIVWEDAHAA